MSPILIVNAYEMCCTAETMDCGSAPPELLHMADSLMSDDCHDSLNFCAKYQPLHFFTKLTLATLQPVWHVAWRRGAAGQAGGA